MENNSQGLELGELRIKLIGVGGAGNNLVDRIAEDQPQGITLSVVNTDMQALSRTGVEEKLLIGRKLTRGFSAGGSVEMGRRAAQEDAAAIGDMVEGVDLLFLVAGMGAGTGGGAAPVIAEAATRAGSVVIAFVTMPFSFEGGSRLKLAQESLVAMRKTCDAVITLPNDVLMQYISEEATVVEAFTEAGNWVARGVQSLTALLLRTGLINVDFPTLKKVFVNRGGRTLYGLGYGAGEHCVAEALRELSLCPLLHTPEQSRKADTLLINIIGGRDLEIGQVNEILASVTERFSSRDNTVIGAVIDESKRQEVEICIIGTTHIGGRRYIPDLRHNSASPAAPAADLARVHTHDRKAAQKHSKDQHQQDEFEFSDAAQRGFFEKSELNLYKGEDLDVPTYLRRGIRI